jgi:hypothetical protein
MGKKKSANSWETSDIALQHLYGLSLFDERESSPIFGSGIKVELANGTAGDRRWVHDQGKGSFVPVYTEGMALMPPTLLNLTWHFGFMQWAQNNVNTIIHKSKGTLHGGDFDQRFFLAAQKIETEKFERKYVLPLRNALAIQKRPLYLYCVPSISVETELVTGKPLTIEGDPVLCLLPVSVKGAKEYQLTEQEIYILAPQVIWLIKNLCSYNAIKTAAHLAKSINGWSEYLSVDVRQQVQEAIEKSNPHLITTQVRLLLSASA